MHTELAATILGTTAAMSSTIALWPQCSVSLVNERTKARNLAAQQVLDGKISRTLKGAEL